MFLGLAMSITSTVVTVRILEELKMIQDKSSILLLGISIIEDIIAITALGIFQSIAADAGQVSILQISISIGIVAAFVGSLLIFGSKFIPNIIDKVGKTNDYALLLIVILGLAFGLSFVAKELGLSVATGAFLAGVLVAESKSAPVAKVVTIPLRDVFATIILYINWRIDGYILNTIVHCSCNDTHSNFICFKILNNYWRFSQVKL